MRRRPDAPACRRRTLLVGPVVAALAAAAAGSAAPQTSLPLNVAIVARAVAPGEVVRLDLTCECAAGAPRVTSGHGTGAREVPLFPVVAGDGRTVWQGLLGIDLDAPAGVLPLAVHEMERPASPRVADLRVAARQFPVRRLQVAPNFVEPPAGDLARIARDAAALDALFAGASPRFWSGAFIAPVATRATINFGARSVFNGQARNPHGGIDFSSPSGTPVVAPAAGRVALAEDLFFTGHTVIIDHGAGLFSVLAHLSAMAVAQGDVVDRGAVVGRVGATGRVTGAHLHWGVRLGGARVDPLSLIFATSDRSSGT